MGLESAKHMSFQEWKEQNKELIEGLKKCPVCEGTGKIECDWCGHDNACLECEGKGYFGETPYRMYVKQLDQTEKRLKSYFEMVGGAK